MLLMLMNVQFGHDQFQDAIDTTNLFELNCNKIISFSRIIIFIIIIAANRFRNEDIVIMYESVQLNCKFNAYFIFYFYFIFSDFPDSRFQRT